MALLLKVGPPNTDVGLLNVVVVEVKLPNADCGGGAVGVNADLMSPFGAGAIVRVACIKPKGDEPKFEDGNSVAVCATD